MVVVTVGGESYYMNRKLKEKWDKLKDGKLAQIDEDRVYIVDGREGSGKSVFAFQQAAYIDPSIVIDLSRITFSAEDTLEKIRNTKSTKSETRVIVWDEAFRGLSSKAALSKTNKKLVQVLMEMRQNNLVLFIVTPSFFMLEMYGAVLRSSALFHIVKDKKTSKRFYRGFNYQKKNKLYNIGIKKGWGYKISTYSKDWFFNHYPGGAEFEKKYRAKKYKTFRAMDPDTPKEYSGDDEKFFIKKFLQKGKEAGLKVTQKDYGIILSISQGTLRKYEQELCLK